MSMTACFRFPGVWYRVDVLLILLVVWLSLLGQMPVCQGGWFGYPAQGVSLPVPVAKHRRRYRRRKRDSWRQRFADGSDFSWRGFVGQRWRIVVLRCGLLFCLWYATGGTFPVAFCLLPVVGWGFGGIGTRFLWLKRQPEWRFVDGVLTHGYRGLLLCCVVQCTGELLEAFRDGVPIGVVGLGCLRSGENGSSNRVDVRQDAAGDFQATLTGHFTLRVTGDCVFRVRLLYLFLRLLEVPGETRKSRRTRDGRTPFVRQQALAKVFGICQPDLSRIEGYWLDGDWPNLLSLQTPLVLTQEVLHRIVEVFAAFPSWHWQQVYHYLQKQGLDVSQSQVRQAAQQSGWSKLRQCLVHRYRITAQSFRPRDNWLVSELLSHVQLLLEKVESAEGMTPEERLSVSDLQTFTAEAGIEPILPIRALPWVMRLSHWLLGRWEPIPETDAQQALTICCCYCGSTAVARKSRKPRLKRYYDEMGKVQQVEVYRYYCRNSECEKGSFTHLPPGLVPYSRYQAPVRVLAVQIYVWGMSTYRRTGQTLGVTAATAYRWVSRWGEQHLPMAALFGVVRCSGVVGVDEKYVLVPKNDKPHGRMRRWMYVYFAIDMYTYDLLHIAIYPHNDLQSAQTFLLALRVKGYQPRVLVTDLRRDYGAAIAPVFPRARHHECLFHALQHISKMVEDVYGKPHEQPHKDKSPTDPEHLKKAIVDIFAAKTKRTAIKRLQRVMKRRQVYVDANPGADTIFQFLSTHWPKLCNAIESQVIPKTNNAVELVIRRFDQHYQSFCGFENIQTAKTFLAVFEKIYRTTPFSLDAQPRIRGKSPLELAGYDLSKIPRAQPLVGQTPDTTPIMRPEEERYVPNL